MRSASTFQPAGWSVPVNVAAGVKFSGARNFPTTKVK